MFNWLYIHLGVNGTGPYYGFWSGFGSDLGEIAIVGAILKFVNCHEKGCWRPGIHYRGTTVCHKHRPIIQSEEHGLLNEIHKHLTAISPKAGNFPPERDKS